MRASRGKRRAGPLVLIAVLAAASLTPLALLPAAQDRISRGIDEVRSALRSDDYTTDTGNRINMGLWALAATREHPIVGVGAGGYKPWVNARSADDARRLGAPAGGANLVHAHAHSWYLHSLATLGIVGAALLFGATALLIRSGLRGPRIDAGLAAPAGYAIGPALGLLGLAGVGMFDPITINAQTAYVFFVLAALCLSVRPRAIDELSQQRIGRIE